jgi:hypothetical protein
MKNTAIALLLAGASAQDVTSKEQKLTFSRPVNVGGQWTT